MYSSRPSGASADDSGSLPIVCPAFAICVGRGLHLRSLNLGNRLRWRSDFQISIGECETIVHRTLIEDRLQMPRILDGVHFGGHARFLERFHHFLRTRDGYESIIDAAEKIHRRVIGCDERSWRSIAVVVRLFSPRAGEPVR